MEGAGLTATPAHVQCGAKPRRASSACLDDMKKSAFAPRSRSTARAEDRFAVDGTGASGLRGQVLRLRTLSPVVMPSRAPTATMYAAQCMPTVLNAALKAASGLISV